MKRLASLLLIGIFAATHFASAEDSQETARRNLALSKSVDKNAARGHPRAIQNTQHFQQYNRNVVNRTYNNARVYNPSSVHRTYVNPNVNVTNKYSRSQNWHNGVKANNNANAVRNLKTRENFSVNHHWDRERRDRGYWRSHYDRFALFGGGYYYWNEGYWYPAYGYDPTFSSYVYDAPIYAYNNEDPGQVIADVQRALQSQGYNPGGVDGTYGPATRRALVNYQRDNGLDPTGEIDEATLGSLGLQ